MTEAMRRCDFADADGTPLHLSAQGGSDISTTGLPKAAVLYYDGQLGGHGSFLTTFVKHLGKQCEVPVENVVRLEIILQLDEATRAVATFHDGTTQVFIILKTTPKTEFRDGKASSYPPRSDTRLEPIYELGRAEPVAFEPRREAGRTHGGPVLYT